jgi:cysteine desulfurase / selenocysteine lyase
VGDDSRFAAGFGPFDGRVWLNAAHQGPLPRVALSALEQAAAMKRSPHRIADGDFLDVPRRLREAIGAMLSVSAHEIVVGNSATYGLQLLVDGLDWRDGDEVLVVANDFPANITPWLALSGRAGVRVRVHEPRVPMLTGEELARVATGRTRLLCTSWVNSFTGHVLDVDAVGGACRDRGIIFVLNATQGLGAMPLHPASLPVDALTSSGFKWLCGPYGTGFAWILSTLLARLRPVQSYWLTLPDDGAVEEALSEPFRPREPLGHRNLDVFGTASFLNLLPWTAAVEYLQGIGVDVIRDHNDRLVRRLLERLDTEDLRILSPTAREPRSPIAVFSHRDEGRNPQLHAALTSAGIDTAIRNGRIRVSGHLYNSEDEIDRLAGIVTATRS